MPEDTPRTCPRCGAALPAGTTECPKCLLGLGLKGRASPSDEGAIPSGIPPETLSSEPPSLEEVRAAFPGLDVEALLGRGGMGAVFKARQRKLERTVALKVLPRGLGADPAFAERFLREARALAKLSHPGIVAVHDFGQSDGLFFLVMEFVGGVDLRRLLRAGAIEPRQALAIARDLCDALQYAHDEGVVHRDIKPENVLVDAQGRVKIADFGLAKLVGPSADAFVTRTDQVMGTPHYMAPEQLERPREVDHRADIFALGVVLYEMLTGSLPRGNFEPPSRRVQVDVRLDEIVLKALEREPERRYQQALEVKTDVDHVTTTARDDGEARPSAAPLPPARRDWFRGPRALAFLAVMWIALAALWNGGPSDFAGAVGLAILALGVLLQSRVRADPELSAAIDAEPRGPQAMRIVAAVAAVALGLFAVNAGHVLHWERGTEHWRPSHEGPRGGLAQWQANPWRLLQLGSAEAHGRDPVVRMERGFRLSATEFASLPPFLLIGIGIVLLAIAITTAVGVRGSADVRQRSRNLGMEISSYALLALVLLWIGAPIAALRTEFVFEGIEQRVESPAAFDDVAEAMHGILRREGLQVDVEEWLSVDEKTSGEPILRARVYRAQAESPFDRWRTSFRGPLRESPQLWTTLVEHPAGEGSTILVKGGLYDARSEEITRARETVRRIQGALAGL